MKTIQLSSAMLMTLLISASAQDQASPEAKPSNNQPKAGVLWQQRAGAQSDQGLLAWVDGARRYPRGEGMFMLRFSEEPKEQSNLESDLGVMSHLLRKTLAEKFGQTHNGRNVLGVNLAFTPGAQPIRTAYFEGYGALFFLNVSFPLYPPPAQAKGAKEKNESDSAWEEAKREFYGELSEPAHGGRVADDYDEQKVEALKSTLLDTLKSAANIRGLRPDDYIILCVSGGSSVFTPATQAMSGRGYGIYGTGGGIAVGEMNTRASVLSARVKKSDIDAFAAGKSSIEEFSRLVKFAASQSHADNWPGDNAYYPSGGGLDEFYGQSAK